MAVNYFSVEGHIDSSISGFSIFCRRIKPVGVTGLVAAPVRCCSWTNIFISVLLHESHRALCGKKCPDLTI